MARDRTPVHVSAQAAPSGPARRVECKDAWQLLSDAVEKGLALIGKQ